MIPSQQRLKKPKMENENQNPKNQLIARLKESNNVLVTVSRNPSVDQLSAAIGLTLFLNSLGKHATAVFSGQVPDTLEFLKPEETLEKNTDSLRDFIISLDKAKADKLRYKVEDTMVKIFITPYRTSLSEADLIYGQGDFNVDVVVAIGVHEKEDLDEAITSHGRILHDATVAALNTTPNGQLGSINWVDTKASSLSEMLVTVGIALKADAMDAQMATAFLTGIVAETNRFSNEKTSSETMNISAKLMAAGANQQLVATKLEEPAPEVHEANTEIESADDNEIEIDNPTQHDGSLNIAHQDSEERPQDEQPAETSELPEVQPDHEPEENSEDSADESSDEKSDNEKSRFILEPPERGGTLTANSKQEALDPSTDPMTLPPVTAPIMSHDNEAELKDILAPLDTPQEQATEPEPPKEPPKEELLPADEPFDPFKQAPEPVQPQTEIPVPAPAAEPVSETPPPAQVDTPAPAEQAQDTAPQQPAPKEQTLVELESAVGSPHIEEAADDSQENKTTASVDAALAAAHEAFDAAGGELPEKPAAFNSAGLMEVNQEAADEPAVTPPAAEITEVKPTGISIDPVTGNLSYPTNLVPPSDALPSDPTATNVEDPTAPPPVPPPMAMPPMMPPVEPPADDTLPPPSQ